MRNFLATDLLASRRALVTGGGTGLGLAMSRRFLELGAEVVICGRRSDVLDSVAKELRADHPGRVEHRTCDIRSANEVELMFNELFSSRPIDILVNNAGANFIAQTERLSTRAADAILSTSLHGTLYCTMSSGRHWIDAHLSGVVLSILSTSTITGRAFTVPSAMAKSAVLAMTKSLAVEWGPRGIRLIAVAPGSLPTPGADAQLNPSSRKQDDIARRVPIGRHGEHRELADLASFLVSDAAAYMTGEMVVLDGGAHLRTSGAEDLCGWTNQQWEAHRLSRSKA